MNEGGEEKEEKGKGRGEQRWEEEEEVLESFRSNGGGKRAI